jgi:hypothetical protein
MKRKLLENNSCPEVWEIMNETPIGRHCEKCSRDLEDLSETSIQEIIQIHVGANKCVRLSTSQIDVLNYIKNKGKRSLAASLLIGASLLNPAYSQTTDANIARKDFCTLKGQLVFKGRRIDLIKERRAGTRVYIVINGQTYETKSNEEGYFSFRVPKNSAIEYSNIKKLEHKKIRSQNTINVRKVKGPVIRERVGFL